MSGICFFDHFFVYDPLFLFTTIGAVEQFVLFTFAMFAIAS
jgi:hypothetical protein